MSDVVFYTFLLMCILVLVRNEWVFRLRIWMIRTDIDQYITMPGQIEMIFDIRVWSARGFGWRYS